MAQKRALQVGAAGVSSSSKFELTAARVNRHERQWDEDAAECWPSDNTATLVIVGPKASDEQLMRLAQRVPYKFDELAGFRDVQVAKDMDGAYWNERRWGAAIAEWKIDRDAPQLQSLIRAESTIPAFAREFLAGLVAGKVHRGKGGRRPISGAEKRKILATVFAEWERLGSKERACASASELFGITEDAARGIADEARDEGLSLEAWVKCGRPDLT